MPARRLPQTDDQRSDALATINDKFQATAPALRLISDEQFEALGGVLSPWRASRTEAGRLLGLQTTATSVCSQWFTKSARVNSHFIQVLNFAIEREVLLPGVRGFYQLPTGHAEVPEMTTPASALQWAGKLADGEAERVGNGGASMEWPEIGEVNAAATELLNSDNAQSIAKDAFDLAQEDVSAQRAAVDLLIKDLWDTIEYRLRAETPSSLRRKAREWGVVYEGTDEEEEEEGGGGAGGGGTTPPPGP